jgi:hypothetical protein
VANRTALLLAALATDLATIRTTNGYRTNLGAAVGTADVQQPQASAPRVTLRVDEMLVQDIATSIRQRTYRISIEAHLPASFGDGTENAHDALEDLLDRFPALRQYALEAGAQADVRFAAGRVLPDAAGIAVSVAQVVLDALLKETL